MKIKINSKFPISLIKLNYKCPFNGMDFTCNTPVIGNSNMENATKTINKYILPGNKNLDTIIYEKKTIFGNVGQKPSPEIQKAAKDYGIKNPKVSLMKSWDLITNISKGDQDAGREQIYEAFDNRGDTRKALELLIAAETIAFKNDKGTLYRKGGYHENTIESYTYNSRGANMTWMTDPDNHIGVDFSKTTDELLADGWMVLAGVNSDQGYIGESEVILINMKDIESGNIKRSGYDSEETWAAIDQSRIQKEAIEHQKFIKTAPIRIGSVSNNNINLNTHPMNIDSAVTLMAKAYEEEYGDDKPLYTNPIIDEFSKATGFDALPTLVDMNKAEELLNDNNLEIFISTNPDLLEEYKNSKKYTINQAYTSNVLSNEFLSYNDVSNKIKKQASEPDHEFGYVRAIISRDAKLINESELIKITNDLLNKSNERYKKYNTDAAKLRESKSEASNLYNKMNYERSYSAIFRKPEVAAMVLGYDGIINDNNNVQILNRGSIYIQDDYIPHEKFKELSEYISIKQQLDSSKKLIDYERTNENRIEKINEFQSNINKSTDKLETIKKTLFNEDLKIPNKLNSTIQKSI